MDCSENQGSGPRQRQQPRREKIFVKLEHDSGDSPIDNVQMCDKISALLLWTDIVELLE